MTAFVGSGEGPSCPVIPTGSGGNGSPTFSEAKFSPPVFKTLSPIVCVMFS